MFRSTQGHADLFLKSHYRFSTENHKNWVQKNVTFFTKTSVFTNNIVIKKYLQSHNPQMLLYHDTKGVAVYMSSH